jgi:transposase
VNEKVAAIANSSLSETVGDFPPNKAPKVRGSVYDREERLRQLHKMLMRDIPLSAIAKQFDVSVHTVMRDRKELYSRLRDQASDINLNELVGGTMGFYNEIQSMALRTASSTKTPMAVRMAALRTALSAKNDNHRFLQAAGVFDVLRFQSGEDQSGGSDIEKLVELTERMMLDDAETEDLAEDFGIDIEDDEQQDDENFDIEEHQRLF